MQTEKKKGRPKTDKAKAENLIIRVDSVMVEDLDIIVNKEIELTGYNLSRSDIVRKALSEYIQKHKD